MSEIPIILASSSPRRRQLLEDAGIEATVIPPDPLAECGICSRETPPELVARLAYQKAQNIAQTIDRAALVIGCDTVAECCGQILGKPKNRDHAREMLQLMSGRAHRVYSGLCLWRRPTDRTEVQVDVTSLVMDRLESDWVERYLETDKWEGKAGAFGFQDGLDWVHIESGSESNVVGLPMELFARMVDRMMNPTDR